MRSTPITLCAIAACLCSCEVNPFAVITNPSNNDRIVLSTGGGFLSESTNEGGSVTYGEYKVDYWKTGKNQTGVAKSFIRTQGTKDILTAPAAKIGSGVQSILTQ